MIITTSLNLTWESCPGDEFCFEKGPAVLSSTSIGDADHKQERTRAHKASDEQSVYRRSATDWTIFETPPLRNMKSDMSYLSEWGKMWQKRDLRFRSRRRKSSAAPAVDRWARENAHQMPYFIKVIPAGSSSNPPPSHSRQPRYRKPRLYRPSMVIIDSIVLPGKRYLIALTTVCMGMFSTCRLFPDDPQT